MRQKVVLITSIVLVSLLIMGCGVCNLATQKGKELAATKIMEEVTKAVGKESDDGTATPTPKPGAAKPTARPGKGSAEYQALTELDSYRYTMSLTGRDKEQDVALDAEGAYVKEPLAFESDVEVSANFMDSSGSSDEMQVIRLIQVNNVMYFYSPEQEGWIATDAGASTMIDMNVTDMIMKEMSPMLDDKAFKLVDEHEDIDGVDCRHYQADVTELAKKPVGEGYTVTEGTADMWVSNELGYMARYTIDFKGQNSDGKPMNVALTMDIFDVNQDITIEPPDEEEIVQDMTGGSAAPTPAPLKPTPAESDGVAKTLPRPEDATELTGTALTTGQAMATGGDYDLYQTKLSVEKTAEFLEEAYVEAGWTKELSVPPTSDMAILVFKKGSQTVNVIVTGAIVQKASVVVVSVQ